MKRLNILILSHYFFPDIGGIESHSELLARHFVQAGHTVHLLTWSPDSTHTDFLFVIVRNPTTTTLFREHAWADVVLENNICLRLSWPNLFVRRPILTSLHTWITQSPETGGLAASVKHRWLKRVGMVVACSETMRNACWPDSRVIANPYDDTLFRRLSNVAQTKDFVFLGRLVSDKGVDIAIKALHRYLSLANTDPGSTLTIIGDGPERNALQLLANELGVADHVTFTGSLTGERLAECLNQHRYLLVPSVWKEPYGMVALEGMACGCVPIVSDGGGLPEAVGKAGLISKRGDVNALADCMMKLAGTPALAATMRQAADAHLAEHKKQRVADRYLALLRNLAVS